MNRKNEIQVGLVFITSMAILVFGVMWFKEFSVGGSFHEAVVEFQNTSGLQQGDPVEVAGVSSGSVKGIVYHEGKSRVTLQLEREITVPPKTKVVIENVGIMGQKMVAVYPGEINEAPVPEDVDFVGEYQVGLGGLMGDAAEALSTLNRLVARLEVFLDEINQGEDQGVFMRIITNLDTLTEQMAQLAGNGEGSLQESLGNFNRAMGTVHTTLEENREGITQAMESTTAMAARADTTMAALESTLTRLDGLLADLEAGQGTAGKLLKDEAMYENMKFTLEETRLLIEEIKANPRKFFKFSVF